MFKFVVLALVAAVAQAAMNPSNCGQPSIAPNECNDCTRLESALTREFYRIVGGTTAKRGSWPWQVQMKLFSSHYCGGSIVDSNTIVTAAHCFDQYQTTSYFTMIVGSHSKSGTDSSQKSHKVSRIYRHAKYNSRTIDNDIALVKTSTNMQWTNEVSPVCIPSTTASDGSNVFVTGWGNTLNQGPSATYLKQTMVPIVNAAKCNTAYSGRITNNMICAGYSTGGHDACQGDSGGPLVQKSGGKWYLHGITSWGTGCAQAAYPGVYTKVSKYYNWISQNM